VCISIGGSILSKESGINVKYVNELAALLKKRIKNTRFIFVVGGGYSSRLYISSTRSIISNNAILDQIGIAFTRINALILKDLLSEFNVYPNIVTTMEELTAGITLSDIVIMGGIIPGITTDSVAMLACELTGCKKMINISRENYVYDRPIREKGAKKLPKLNHQQLVDIANRCDDRSAGSNFILDFFAAKIAKRSNIDILFVNDSITELAKALDGKKHTGSIVRN
jgi:uridylate kinase